MYQWWAAKFNVQTNGLNWMKIRVAWFERYFYFFFIAILDPVLVFQKGYLKSSVSVSVFFKASRRCPSCVRPLRPLRIQVSRSWDHWDEEGDDLPVGWFQHGNFLGKRTSKSTSWNFRGRYFSGDQIYSPQINAKTVGPKPTFFGCPSICFFSTSMILPLEFPHVLKSGDHYNSISPSNDGKNMGMILWPLV